jgi:hypothetical protein
MVKPKLTLFQMQMECRLALTPEPGKPGLSVSPEALDSIDMTYISGELVLSVVDAQMFFEPQIHQPVVASPAIGVNHAIKADSATNDCLQGCLLTIRRDF